MKILALDERHNRAILSATTDEVVMIEGFSGVVAYRHAGHVVHTGAEIDVRSIFNAAETLREEADRLTRLRAEYQRLIDALDRQLAAIAPPEVSL